MLVPWKLWLKLLKPKSTDTAACLCFLGDTCKDKMEDNSWVLMKLKRCKLQCELGFCKVKLKILYNYMTGIKKKYSEDT